MGATIGETLETRWPFKFVPHPPCIICQSCHLTIALSSVRNIAICERDLSYSIEYAIENLAIACFRGCTQIARSVDLRSPPPVLQISHAILMTISADCNSPKKSFLDFFLALTIFISAFLLFQVQPLISKFILPWFGGSPAVWTTAMLFFQCTLFLGYVYSHLLFCRLNLANQVRTHLVLLTIASVMAFFVVPLDSLKPKGTDDPTSRILLLLTICVGLPYAVLSTTGPLIQAWFSRAYPGRSPYRLFSLSNVGSLIALGTFPFLFEPYLELKTMGRIWMVGFWVFAGLCATCGLHMFQIAKGELVSSKGTFEIANGTIPHSWQRLFWVGLSALSSLMFIATTNHVCHDIATVPFLWIIPLALYLLTFIICFDHPRWYVRELWCGLCITAIFTLVCLDFDWSVVPNLILHFGTMFLICMVCHGELVKLRPENQGNITEYYLMISAGGALGGLFVTLVATRYFDEYYEWPLGLILSFAIAAGAIGVGASKKKWLGPTSFYIAGIVVLSMTCYVSWCLDPFDWLRSGERFGVKKILLMQDRNFYGTVSVTDRQYTKSIPPEDNDGISRDIDSGHRSFWSGNILHGLQWTDPKKQDLPLTYYDRESGVGKALQYCIEQTHRVALAAYARPATGNRSSDECVMYEINPIVEQIAREHFWYLPNYEKRLGKAIEVRLGDARLSMEREVAQDYDIIVLDAFSGDSVPAHLLTREAFEIYHKHLKKNADGKVAGMICIHITNTYLNLYPVVKNAAEQVVKMKYTSFYKLRNPQDLLMRSHYFIMTNDQVFLDQNPMVAPFVLDSSESEMKVIEQDWPNIALWTDHYSTIFNILWSE